MTPLQKEGFEITLANLNTVHVTVEAVVGPFVIHQRICLGATTPDAYTVTHRTSGIAIWTTQLLVDAIHVAEWLEEQKLLPTGNIEMWEWKAQLRQLEKDKLIEQLSGIAIRFADGTPTRSKEHTS